MKDNHRFTFYFFLVTAIFYFIALAMEWSDVRVFSKFIPIALLVIWVGQYRQYRYNRLLTIGLAFSAGGDILLELNNVHGYIEERFLAGMAAFFIAHCCYLTYFTLLKKRLKPTLLGVSLVSALTVWLLVSDDLQQLLIPVSAYIIVVSLMLWRALAASEWTSGLFTRNNSMAWGAISFAISDSLLAFSTFTVKFAMSHWLIMATYYFAQFAIAFSAVRNETNKPSL